MHTLTINGTSFVYNSDFSGNIIVVSKGHSVETTFDAIEGFVIEKRKMEAIAKIEQGEALISEDRINNSLP